jgi:hypothetical protein
MPDASGWPAFAPGVIYACALRDELVARARAFDAEALATLLDCVPPDLPVAVRRIERDRRIGILADGLFALLPRASVNSVALLLAEAGDQLERRRRALEGRRFDILTDAEREELARSVGGILAWAPARRDGGRWPCLRTLTAIVRPFAKVGGRNCKPTTGRPSS